MPLKKSVTKKPADGSVKATPKPQPQASAQSKKEIADAKADKEIANLQRMARPNQRIDDYID